MLCGGSRSDQGCRAEQRLANIASNQALLASLNLPSVSDKPAPRKKTGGSSKRVKKEASEDNVTAMPTRRSARHSTVIQTDPEEAEKVRKRQREEEDAYAESVAQAKRARHEDRTVEIIYKTGREWKSDEEKKFSTTALSLVFDGLVSAEHGLSKLDHDLLPSDVKSQAKEPMEITRLREQVQALVLRKTEKVTPERVYSMMVHPTLEKDLVFVGDKSGALGIADALAPDNEEELEDGQPFTSSWAIRAHAKSAITCIRLNPKNPRLVCARKASDPTR